MQIKALPRLRVRQRRLIVLAGRAATALLLVSGMVAVITDSAIATRLSFGALLVTIALPLVPKTTLDVASEKSGKP